MDTPTAPSTSSRIGAWSMLILGILGTLVLIAGIIGVWVLNTPATDLITGALSTVLGPLEAAQSGLQTVDSTLDTAQAATVELQETVAQVGIELQADSLILKKLGSLVSEDLLGAVDRALESLSNVRVALAGIQGILDGLAKVPFIELPEWAQELSGAIDEVERVADEARETLAAIEAIRLGAVEKAVDLVIEKAETIEGRLQTVQGRVQAAEARVAELVSMLEAWLEAAPGAIDTLSVILTILFGWMAFAQGVVLSLGWSYVKTGFWTPFYPIRKREAAALA